jgi:hypothetical protein
VTVRCATAMILLAKVGAAFSFSFKSSCIHAGVFPGVRGSPSAHAYFITSSAFSGSSNLPGNPLIVVMNWDTASMLSSSVWRLRSNCSTFSIWFKTCGGAPWSSEMQGMS